MKAPLISVIIPCYNYGKYIEETIRSVEQCKEPIYEIIIVNDGSTDEQTITLLNKLSADGYNVINQQNTGLAGARNTAIAAAKGKYILPLDADNMIRPEYMLKALAIFEKEPDIAVVYGEAEYFEEKTGVSDITKIPLEKLFIYNFIDACAVIRKECFDEFGGYDGDMPVMGVEDWEFWLRLFTNGKKFKAIHEPMFYYRVRNGSMLGDTLKPENSLLLKAYILRKHSLAYVKFFDKLVTSANNYEYDKKKPLRSFFKYIILSLKGNG